METLSANTLKAYKADWKDFVKWFGSAELPLQAKVIEQYLTRCERSGMSFGTIRRRTSALAWKHREADVYNPLESDQIRDSLHHIRMSMKAELAPVKRWAPATDEELRLRLAEVNEDVVARTLRNKAIISLMLSSNLRRSEVAALQVKDLEPTSAGLLVRPPKVNSYRRADGRPVFVTYRPDATLCPWECLQKWMDSVAISSGPVFRPVDRWGNLEPNALCEKTLRRVLVDSERRKRPHQGPIGPTR